MKSLHVLPVLLPLVMSIMAGGCDDPRPDNAPAGLPHDPGPCVSNTHDAMPAATELMRLIGTECLLTHLRRHRMSRQIIKVTLE